MATQEFTDTLTKYGVPQKSDEVFIQVSASGIDPVGGASAALLEDYGISTALTFVNGNERVAGFNIAVPANADYAIAPSLRIGWACDDNAGNVRWGVTYNYLALDGDCLGVGTEVLGTHAVADTADAYNFTAITLGVMPAGTRVVQVRLARYGGDALDTTDGDVYVIGALIGFTIGDLL